LSLQGGSGQQGPAFSIFGPGPVIDFASGGPPWRDAAANESDGVGMVAQAVEKVARLIEPILDDMGIELVDVVYLSEGGRWILRIYVDRDGGISLDDCVQVSREIEDVIEVRDFFRQPYVLEVSSPGLNRPLKREKDFARALGKKVAIQMASPVEGRRNFKGRLSSLEDGVLCVITDKTRCLLPLSNVKKANLVYEFGD
jgi:ribosome maturation factor RimP